MASEQNPEPHKRRVRYKGKNPRRFQDKYKELNPERYTDTVAHIPTVAVSSSPEPGTYELLAGLSGLVCVMVLRKTQHGLSFGKNRVLHHNMP